MELKWLEDYLALAEYGSFSKGAEARFVTQPAFGRRIRALENWLGIELVDRQQYPTTLTPMGIEFVEQAQRWVEEFYNTRAQMREQHITTKRVVFVAQHSLTTSFLPHCINSIKPLIKNTSVRINAYNLHDCLDTLLSDQGDFLLSYYSPEIFPQLDREDVMSVQVGTDLLIPVSATNEDGKPLYSPILNDPLKLLSYPDESFFGRLLQRDYFSLKRSIACDIQCENALVEGLKALAIAGNGLAWLPRSTITQELEQGQLVQVFEQLPTPELKIMLYRKKDPRLKDIEIIWNYFSNQESQTYQTE